MIPTSAATCFDSWRCTSYDRRFCSLRWAAGLLMFYVLLLCSVFEDVDLVLSHVGIQYMNRCFHNFPNSSEKEVWSTKQEKRVLQWCKAHWECA